MAFYERGKMEKVVRKILAVFFTFINFHVVLSYQAVAAILAHLWRGGLLG